MVLALAADLAQGCAVLIVAPPFDDAGWRSYIDAIESLQRRTPATIRPAVIQILRRGIPMPSAIVRREMAALRGRIRADAVNAVVVEDPMLRLMQTALDWLRRPHYASSSHDEFAAALAQVEKVLGASRPVLSLLYRQACDRLADGDSADG
jgi:hypothetical protein